MWFRVRLFGGKWFQEIIFPLTRVFGSYGKSFPVDQNLLLWLGNDFTLSFPLQIISGSRAKERESERKKESSAKHSLQSSLRHRSTSRQSRRAQPDDHRSLTVVQSPSQTTQTHGEWELKLTPIQTNAPDPAHSGSRRA